MAGLKQKLPPMNSLVVLEAAARHLNLTRAAEELGVTQAAVSRQISLLEEHLGVPVFRRQARGLELTLDGQRLVQAVSMGLEHIARTTTDIRRVRRAGELTVATSVTFANYWLMPRVAKFRATYPEIDLRLLASGPVRDMVASGVDLAVRYGKGSWPGVDAIHLLDNEVFPVCSPAYLENAPPLETAEDLLNHTLLHLVEYDRAWVSWASWLRGVGVKGEIAERGMEFDSYVILTQAVLDGQGIALGGGRLAEDFLVKGTLVSPIKEKLRSDRSFYLVMPQDVPISRAARLFRDWMVEEARASQPEQTAEFGGWAT